MTEDTPLYRELISQSSKVIDQDIERGRIFEPDRRWDEKDQIEFDSIPIEVLLDDPYYGGGGLWPDHRKDIIQLWAARKSRGVNTFVAQEGIGSGKTHKFRDILRLMVLEVITKADPLSYFDLDPKGQGISFICMSRNAKLAKEVTFTTILKAFDCPFFNEYFPPQVDFHKMEESQKRPSMLRFPKNIVIFPGTGSALSAIGYNLFGGGIDEANYLEVVDDSKKAFQGKHYDAAETMYAAIMARMKSRFIQKGGRVPGLLMLFSNTRHSGDFLERLAMRSMRDKTIFFRRRCTWAAQPKERFSGKTFKFDVYNRKIVR